MKAKLLYLALLLFQVTFSQNGKISGKIVEKNNSEPIPFATIVYESPSQKGSTTSDNQGNFIIEQLKNDQYKLTISFLGFRNRLIENITISNNHYKTGNITLESTETVLNTVEVKSTKSTYKSTIEKKSYNSQDFETAKGGSAMDVLSKIPSMNVTSNGNISLRGTEDFTVYINGKPSQMSSADLLKQIPANMIQKVDVITVPTAKYEAQGKGGIVNIETKKNALQGTSINVNSTIGGAPWGNFTDKYSGFKQNDNRIITGVQISHQEKKFGIYGGINYSKLNINGLREGTAKVLVKDVLGDYFHMNAVGERPEWYQTLTANAGINYNIDDKNDLGLTYLYGKQEAGRSAFYVYNTFYGDANGNAKANEKFTYNPNTDNRTGNFHNISLDYKHLFNKDQKITFSNSYETSALKRNLNNANNPFNTITDEPDLTTTEQSYHLYDSTPLKALRNSLEYSNKLNPNTTLNLGAQNQWTNIAGDFMFDGINTPITINLNNGIDLTRNVQAAFGDIAIQKNKTNYLLGLRAEYTSQEMQVNRTDYLSLFSGRDKNNYKQQQLDFFPSAHISHQLNEKDKISFAASRRINRPSVTKLAPFLYRRHLEVYEVGDPELKPEYLNNAEIGYNTKLGKSTLDITGFYRGVENAVFRVNTVTTAVEDANRGSNINSLLGEDVLIRSYTNAGNSSSLGAESNINFKINNQIKCFIGGAIYQFKVDGQVFGYNVSAESINWNAKTNIIYNLSKTLTLNADYSYTSRTATSQGSNSYFQRANAAINYKPSKLKEFDFSLRGLDLLKSNIEGLDTNATNAANEQIFYQETSYVRYGPIVELAVTYTFNQKSKKSNKDFMSKEHFK